MQPRLVPLNAFISLCKPYDLWPSVLADIGYSVEGLEIPIDSAVRGKLVADIVAFRQETNAVLVAEAKSGKNVDPDQAIRYKSLNPNDAIIGASITIRDPGPRSVDCVYVCLAENQQRILMGLESSGTELPVMSVSDIEVSSVGTSFRDQDINEAFSEPVSVPGSPPRYVSLDIQTPEEDYDEVVRAVMVASLSHRRSYISVRALAELAIPFYSILGPQAKSPLRKKVESSARRVADHDPDSFRYRPATGRNRDARVEFLRQPEEVDRRGRTQIYQAIARAASRGGGQRQELEGQLDMDDLIAELNQSSQSYEI